MEVRDSVWTSFTVTDAAFSAELIDSAGCLSLSFAEDSVDV